MDYKEISEFLFQQLRTITTKSSLADVLNDFNHGEVGVLSYLAFDKDGVSAGELSEKIGVTTARIANILNSLENKKYIKRKEDKLDKRKTIVVITAKGKEIAFDAKEEVINKIAKVIKEIGYDEIKEYARLALKIRQILNKQ